MLLLVQAKSELIFPSLYFPADIGPAQKNKATSYHLGQLKAKLAKLRRELIQGTGGSGGGGGGGIGFDVARYVPVY